MLTKNDKKWITDTVRDGVTAGVREVLDDVVVPGFVMVTNRLDRIESKIDSLEEKVDILDTKIDSVDRKLMRITDHHADLLDNHGKRIIKLEALAL